MILVRKTRTIDRSFSLRSALYCAFSTSDISRAFSSSRFHYFNYNFQPFLKIIFFFSSLFLALIKQEKKKKISPLVFRQISQFSFNTQLNKTFFFFFYFVIRLKWGKLKKYLIFFYLFKFNSLSFEFIF